MCVCFSRAAKCNYFSARTTPPHAYRVSRGVLCLHDTTDALLRPQIIHMPRTYCEHTIPHSERAEKWRTKACVERANKTTCRKLPPPPPPTFLFYIPGIFENGFVLSNGYTCSRNNENKTIISTAWTLRESYWDTCCRSMSSEANRWTRHPLIVRRISSTKRIQAYAKRTFLFLKPYFGIPNEFVWRRRVCRILETTRHFAKWQRSSTNLARYHTWRHLNREPIPHTVSRASWFLFFPLYSRGRERESNRSQRATLFYSLPVDNYFLIFQTQKHCLVYYMVYS